VVQDGGLCAGKHATEANMMLNATLRLNLR
jgi:hypothetical protein